MAAAPSRTRGCQPHHIPRSEGRRRAHCLRRSRFRAPDSGGRSQRDSSKAWVHLRACRINLPDPALPQTVDYTRRVDADLEACLPAALRGPTTKIAQIAAGLSGAGVYRVDAGGRSYVLKIAGPRDVE